MRSLLAPLLALSTLAHADAPPPRSAPTAPPAAKARDVLRGSTECEINAIGALLASTQAVVNTPMAGRDDGPARASLGETRLMWTRANELYARSEVPLAYARAREARRSLRVAMTEVWERGEGAQLQAPVARLAQCTGERLAHTQPIFQSHALIGPRTAWDKARTRLEGAALQQRQGDVRMSYFSVEDAMHQLDVAITQHWAETR